MRFWLLVKLLKWYSSKELDQFELFKFDSKYGKVFVTISRQDIAGITEDIYVELND